MFEHMKNSGFDNEENCKLPCQMMKEMFKKMKENGFPLPCEQMKEMMKENGGFPLPCEQMKKMMKESGMEEHFRPMKKKVFEALKEQFEENPDFNPPPCVKKAYEHLKEMFADENPEFKNQTSQPTAPPAEEAEVLKSDIHKLKEEAKQCRKELKEKKKEQKKKQKELKKVKKAAKKAAKMRFASEVVAHLDLDERSTQVAGTYVLKTWKVKNTGTQAWSSETIATFKKGNREMITPDSMNVIVGTVNPGEVTYIRAMFAIPEQAGTHKVVYRLQSPESGKFGCPMKTFVTVESVKPEPEVEESQPEPVVEPAAEPEPEEEAFPYGEALTTLQSMGFDAEQCKSVLLATEGNVQAAFELLLN